MNTNEQIRAALADAKGWLIECLNEENPPTKDGINEAIDRIDAALSLPHRQCDMGTPEEQAERYNAFCRKHFTPDKLGGNCRKCPLRNRRGWSCQLAWAQMPYAEEGGAK